MNCPNCGYSLQRTAMFCPRCGAKLAEFPSESLPGSSPARQNSPIEATGVPNQGGGMPNHAASPAGSQTSPMPPQSAGAPNNAAPYHTDGAAPNATPQGGNDSVPTGTQNQSAGMPNHAASPAGSQTPPIHPQSAAAPNNAAPYHTDGAAPNATPQGGNGSVPTGAQNQSGGMPNHAASPAGGQTPPVRPQSAGAPNNAAPYRTDGGAPNATPQGGNGSVPTGAQNPGGRQTHKKQCKRCGAPIDPVSKRCTGCGKSCALTNTKLFSIILAALLVLSVGLNGFQFVMQGISQKDLKKTNDFLSRKSAEQEEKIGALQNSLNQQSDTIDSLKGKSAYFDEICRLLALDNVGYASEYFNASESVILVDKDETGRQFMLTAYWEGGGDVSVSFYGDSATVSFGQDTWYTSTPIIVEPSKEGITFVTFINDQTAEMLHVLIVVTDE